MTDILVTAKVHPDLDGVSCTLAYSHLLNLLGRNAYGGVFGEIQSEVQYFVQQQGVTIKSSIDDSQSEYQNFILVDASSMKGMPQVVKADKVIEIIDHRVGEPEKEFPQAKIQNELIGAAATLVVERFQQEGKDPELEEAKLLYGAIYHNTLNFLATNSTERDQKAADYLEKTFNLNKSLVAEMFAFSTDEILADIEKAIEQDAKEMADFHTVIGAYQLILWDFPLEQYKDRAEAQVAKHDKEFGVEWSFLNITNLGEKSSLLYASSPLAEEKLNKALGATFNNKWATLPTPWLRKQIIAKLKETS